MVAAQQLLLVDDDEFLRKRLGRALAARGLSVLAAANYEEAMRHLADHSPDLAVIDLRMPGKSGIDVLRELKQQSPTTRAIVLTGYGSIANAVEAVHAGAVNYVTKPANTDQILDAFHKAGDAASPEPAPDYQPPSLAQAEWNHIQQVLADCDGNVSRAADLLGIPRRTLQRKLKKLSP